MKSLPVGDELFMRTDGRTDGRKDMTKLIVAFSKFTGPPKNKDIL